MLIVGNFLKLMLTKGRSPSPLSHPHHASNQCKESHEHGKEEEEHFNEPSGVLFGIPEGGRLRDVMSPLTWIFLVGFLGGTALFIGLWQYRPDTSAEAWGKRTALKRMRERGVDMSHYFGNDS